MVLSGDFCDRVNDRGSVEMNMVKKIAPTGVLLLVIWCLAGCGSLIVGGAADSADRSAYDTRSASEKNTDAAITTAINRKYVHDSQIDALDIQVYTRQGVVTLTGSVSSQAVASRAIALARATGNVRQVISRLSVRY